MSIISLLEILNYYCNKSAKSADYYTKMRGKPTIFLYLLVLLLALGFPLENHYQKASLGLTPFVYPVMTPRLSSGYGLRKHPLLKFSRKHKGVDLAAPIGAPIRAVSAGRVVFADPYAGYGNLIVIEHASGVTTHYGHCDQISIQTGQKVNPGDIIGTLGNTGMSSGPHLHFELRINGIPEDPEKYIPDLADEALG